MPAFKFTADSGTDQLEIVAHGLLTGAGAGALFNVGGALPAPLTTADDVYVIRVDDDHIKLATSSANALLGVAINLTTNGTGSHWLGIGLPYRRPRTYVPKSVDVAGSQVKSEDFNALFDAIAQGAHSFQQLWQTIVAMDFVDPSPKGYTLTAMTGYGIETTDDVVLYTQPCALDIRPGDVILGIHVRTGAVVSGAAQDFALVGPGSTAGLAINGGAALVANTEYTIDLGGAPYTVPAGWVQNNFALLTAVGVAGNVGNTFVGFGVSKHRPIV
jgi:hypothetical protein